MNEGDWLSSFRHLNDFSMSLYDQVTGNELVLIELMFYLADKGIIDKAELAQRLRTAADRYEKFLAGDLKPEDKMLVPMRRAAEALLESTDIAGEFNDE